MLPVALALPLATAVAWLHLLGSYRAWVGPVHLAVSAILAAVAIAAPLVAWRRAPRASVAAATFLLCGQLGIIALSLAGVRLVHTVLFPDARVAVAIAAVIAFAIVGLLRGRLWGRWLAIALGLTGLLSGGLNAVHFWTATDHPLPAYPEWSVVTYEQAWLYCVSALGGAMIAVLLAPGYVRERLRGGATWTSSDRLVGLLRLTLIAGFTAMPMLLVYACIQPIAPATQTTGVVLAGVLAVASVLTVRGKVIGALLLVLAGLGLLAQTAATFAYASDRAIAGYYAVFWAPAGLLAIACGARLAGPTLRLLRR